MGDVNPRRSHAMPGDPVTGETFLPNRMPENRLQFPNERI